MRVSPCCKSIGRLFGAMLCSTLLFANPPPVAMEGRGDAFLTGYLTSILERDLHWAKDTYYLKVTSGVATITLFTDDSLRQQTVNTQLVNIDGLQGIVVIVQPAEAVKTAATSRGTWQNGTTEAFPIGDLFRPLIADPKQPQFFVSAFRFESLGKRYDMASVGFGETFGLYRFVSSQQGDGLQLSLEGALFAQFDLSTPSKDLVNADYTIGFPVTYRRGDNSIRLRLYHQSSHLGDELLLSANPPNRVNLSYESIEFLYSREWRGWRVYGGGEYLIDKDPSDLKPRSLHWGAEYRADDPLFGSGRPIGGVDMKKLEEHAWATETSVKAGLEFGHPNPGQRRLRWMAEWYKGFDPHGQFYINRVEYYGLGVSLGF